MMLISAHAHIAQPQPSEIALDSHLLLEFPFSLVLLSPPLVEWVSRVVDIKPVIILEYVNRFLPRINYRP